MTYTPDGNFFVSASDDGSASDGASLGRIKARSAGTRAGRARAWLVKTVCGMPIVLWLSKEKATMQKGQKRTAAPDGGHTAAGNDRHRHTAASFGLVSGEHSC